jgi:hypothetical protein
LTFLSAPGGNVDLAIVLYAAVFGAAQDSVSTRGANGLGWRLLTGTLQGYPVDLAITAKDGQTYIIVLMSGYSDERDALYQQVFLPIVDAFMVK